MSSYLEFYGIYFYRSVENFPCFNTLFKGNQNILRDSRIL
jgi:hypothetical protein